jgi:hypothetical protein
MQMEADMGSTLALAKAATLEQAGAMLAVALAAAAATVKSMAMLLRQSRGALAALLGFLMVAQEVDL